jgi:hypothetical protein
MLYLEGIQSVMQVRYLVQAVNYSVGYAECKRGWLGYYRIYSGRKPISAKSTTIYEAWLDAAKRLGWKGDEI